MRTNPNTFQETIQLFKDHPWHEQPSALIELSSSLPRIGKRLCVFPSVESWKRLHYSYVFTTKYAYQERYLLALQQHLETMEISRDKDLRDRLFLSGGPVDLWGVQATVSFEDPLGWQARGNIWSLRVAVFLCGVCEKKVSLRGCCPTQKIAHEFFLIREKTARG